MKKLLAFSIVALMITSCSNHEKHLLLDVREVDYRNHTDFVLEGKPIDIEAMGLEDIIFCDSFLLVVSGDPNGMAKVYDPRSHNEVARFCYKGRAKNEFISMMLLYDQQYIKDGKTIIPIVDNDKVFKELDFTSSMQRGYTIVGQVGDCPRLHEGSVGLINNDINTLFYNTGAERDKVKNKWHAPKFSIYDVKKDKKTELKVYSGIMNIRNEDFYTAMYSGTTRKHPEKNLFVHALRDRDYIYFFDLDNNIRFAIHQQGTTTFDDKLSEPELKENRRTFANGLCTDDFFMVLYIGGDYFVESPEESKAPELLLFDFEGNFLCGVKVMNDIHKIAYDPRTKTLYGANILEEIIYSYDISEIVDCCHEKN